MVSAAKRHYVPFVDGFGCKRHNVPFVDGSW